MSTRRQTRRSVNPQQACDEQAAREVVEDEPEELARRGAREMLSAALDEEVEAYLGRGRYERVRKDDSHGGGVPFRGYRNGSTPRQLTLGSGTINLRAPRVRDLPPGQEPFESRVLRKYERRSDTIEQTFLRLFIEGHPGLRAGPATTGRPRGAAVGQRDQPADPEIPPGLRGVRPPEAG